MKYSNLFSTLLLAVLSIVAADSVDDRSLIVGGVAVTDTDDSPHVPFIVGLRRFDNPNGNGTIDQSIVCGGVLIAPDVVLTIGHCIDYDDLILIRCYFGSTSRPGAPDFSKEEVQEIDAESWDIDDTLNITETTTIPSPALGLIFLERAVNDIEPINLKVDPNGPLQGAELNLVGYGAYPNEAGEQVLSEVLRDVELQVNFTSICNKDYDGVLDNTYMFCGGGGGKGACNGDAGAPVIDDDGHVTGITLFGDVDCGNKPTIFSRVGAFTQFLKDEVCGRVTADIDEVEWCSFEQPALIIDVGGLVVCFGGSSSVEVQTKNGEKDTISMTDLSIGDMVHVGNDVFEPVYSFGHYDPLGEAHMLQIKMANNVKSVLHLSPDHMVMTESLGAIPASHVRAGDKLLTTTGTDTVKSVRKNVISRGLYAPFTPSGKIAVDGIIASNYIAFEDTEGVELFSRKISHQWMAHAGSFPHRMACHYFGNSCENETYTSKGISTGLSRSYAFYKNLFDTINSGVWFVRLPLLICTLLGLVAFSVVESMILNPLSVLMPALFLLGVATVSIGTGAKFVIKTKVA